MVGSHSGNVRDGLDLTLLGTGVTLRNDKIKGYKTEFKNFSILKVIPVMSL